MNFVLIQDSGPVEISIVVIGAILWIWALVDCIRWKHVDRKSRAIWLVVILFFTWIGALVYFIFRRLWRT